MSEVTGIHRICKSIFSRLAGGFFNLFYKVVVGFCAAASNEQ